MAKGVVWLSVSSTARRRHDYKAPAELAAWLKAQNAASTATLMDDERQDRPAPTARRPRRTCTSSIRRGRCVYAGAIDDKPTSTVADIQGATNYVTPGARARRWPAAGVGGHHRAYGCSVKYGS